MSNKAPVSMDGNKGNITISHLFKRFGKDSAVHDLNLTIGERELMVFLGPSGCGKTTTLNLLAGLEEPDGGEIYFGTQKMNSVLPEDRDISMVFQSIGLYPHLNVRENIAFPLRLRKVPPAEINARMNEITQLLGIGRLLDRRIHQLSGGERQRAAIAKALVKRPRLFLLDEPFSSLDADMRRQFRWELARIHRELQTTMVFVTHDQEEAMSIADRIALMRGGELVQVGYPLEIYYQPANVWTSQFIGTHPINMLACRLLEATGEALLFDDEPVTLRLDPSLVHRIRERSSADEFMMGVRPEFVVLDRRENMPAGIRVEVFSKQILGSDTLYEVTAGLHHLRAVQPSAQQFAVGEALALGFLWDKVFVFDRTTEKGLIYIDDYDRAPTKV